MYIFETKIETETRKMVETETESLADLCNAIKVAVLIFLV